jgi:hypothetical protein
MSDNFEETIDDDVKNLYIIKRRLSEVKRNRHGYFEYFVGDSYVVKIFPIGLFLKPPATVTHYKIMDITLYSLSRDKKDPARWNENHIRLDSDPTFKNYKPIQYAEFEWNNNGHNMPILHLCELIKYLHRLTNLKVFI